MAVGKKVSEDVEEKLFDKLKIKAELKDILYKIFYKEDRKQKLSIDSLLAHPYFSSVTLPNIIHYDYFNKLTQRLVFFSLSKTFQLTFLLKLKS